MNKIDHELSVLLASGVWIGSDKYLKKNCSKCYNRRHVGKYLIWYQKQIGKDGNIITNTGNNQYVLCNCIKKAIPKMYEDEEKNKISIIGEESLKILEEMNDK